MSFIRWKQIDPELNGSGNLTGSLRLSGSFFLNDVNIVQEIQESGIFRLTGSFWSTTNNVQVTGSLDIKLTQSNDAFSVQVDEDKKFEINKNGIFIFPDLLELPEPITGSLAYSASAFFVGI